MIIDTHCHIYGSEMENAEEIIEKAAENGIQLILNGTDPQSNIEVLELSSRHDNVHAALGYLYPFADEVSEKEIDLLDMQLKNNDVVAVGEIGLDYYYGKDDKDKQIEVFRKQLEIAQDLKLPVVIHSRDATEDTIRILKEYNVKGVIHSFSGSYETAKIYLSMGFKLGINGVITFKNCNLKDVYSRLSVNDIMLETDSPYLTPVPFRGKRNEPSHIKEIAEFVANIYNVSVGELAVITNNNVKEIFDI